MILKESFCKTYPKLNKEVQKGVLEFFESGVFAYLASLVLRELNNARNQRNVLLQTLITTVPGSRIPMNKGTLTNVLTCL